MSQAAREQQGDASPSMFEAVFQYSLCPRWLVYSGLPKALGATQWAVFRAIVELDHQTSKLPGRRGGKDHCLFRVPQSDIVSATGLTERTVRRSVSVLRETKLLGHYKPGGGRQAGAGGSWCTFGVNTSTINDLFAYVIPMLMRIHGGILNVPRSQLPPGGITIYGFGALGLNASA
ncbi:MAG TPA: hypothetical protein VM487_15885, partial [Phycisphaerae bacterium]|nr:hypothetical protein [Phycisphaerae bacterium]